MKIAKHVKYWLLSSNKEMSLNSMEFHKIDSNKLNSFFDFITKSIFFEYLLFEQLFYYFHDLYENPTL